MLLCQKNIYTYVEWIWSGRFLAEEENPKKTGVKKLCRRSYSISLYYHPYPMYRRFSGKKLEECLNIYRIILRHLTSLHTPWSAISL